jgi:hypothetical protein
MKILKLLIPIVIIFALFGGCKKPAATHPMLVFKYVFDSTQARLNNFGQPDTMPAGHAGQSPLMNWMSAHYIELAQNSTTLLGTGAVLYQTPMTTAGGSNAIDFSKEQLTSNNSTFFQMQLDSVAPGTYQWLRISLAYQNYGVGMYVDSTFSYGGYSFPVKQTFPSTIASFIGVNSYITTCMVKTKTLTVNANKAQGFWGFETPVQFSYGGFTFDTTLIQSGQAPAGATTVVNPLFATSPIPQGSCVVTGQFSNGPLTITGKETKDIVVTVSLSINKSFEWIEQGTPDGLWEPLKGESIVNMGIRGMVPSYQ